jgi:hypothetical protein
MVMEAKLTRLTHKIAIQLYLVADSFTIYSYRSRQPVRKRLDTHSYDCLIIKQGNCDKMEDTEIYFLYREFLLANSTN